MSTMDLAVINGLVYREGHFEQSNVFVKNGAIAKIGNESLQAAKTYDAEGKWVLPGLIDPHVHLHLQVGATLSRDDFSTGSMLAAFGGVTTIIDFLDPADTLDAMKKAFAQRLEEAQGCLVDFSFHPTIKGFLDSTESLAQYITAQGMPSVKLFTTYGSTGRQTHDRLLAALCQQSEQSRFTILIHAENNDMVDESLGAPFTAHALRRPPLSEISEVIKLAQIFEYAGGFGYIVHTTCGTTIAKLQEGFAELLDKGRFLIESCPHYLLFDSSCYNSPRGYRYVMTPPLRPLQERDTLRAHFDAINTLATDHCPYTETEKNQRCLDAIPGGIEGMPYTLPVLLSHFGEKILPKMTHECAKIHGLYPQKGTLKEGSDGDMVIFDPQPAYTFQGNMPWHDLLQRDGSTSPYNGIPGKGRICTTFVRGTAVMDNNRLQHHCGKFIKRHCR